MQAVHSSSDAAVFAKLLASDGDSSEAFTAQVGGAGMCGGSSQSGGLKRKTARPDRQTDVDSGTLPHSVKGSVHCRSSPWSRSPTVPTRPALLWGARRSVQRWPASSRSWCKRARSTWGARSRLVRARVRLQCVLAYCLTSDCVARASKPCCKLCCNAVFFSSCLCS